jgi:hypothetical protein
LCAADKNKIDEFTRILLHRRRVLCYFLCILQNAGSRYTFHPFALIFAAGVRVREKGFASRAISFGARASFLGCSQIMRVDQHAKLVQILCYLLSAPRQ